MALDTLTPDEWQALDQAAMAHRLTPMGGQSPSPPIPDMGGLPTISPHVVAPLPATREADIAAGTKLQPGVGKELYAGGLPSVSAEPFTPNTMSKNVSVPISNIFIQWEAKSASSPDSWASWSTA